jgi:hypothetical protein
LGGLAEAQSLLAQPFRFRLTFLLQAVGLLADLFKFLQPLDAVALMGFRLGALQLLVLLV